MEAEEYRRCPHCGIGGYTPGKPCDNCGHKEEEEEKPGQ